MIVNGYCILPMDYTHLDDIMEIERLCFSAPWSREAFTAELRDNRCACYRVILTGGEVIGYAGFWRVLDEAHITNVAIRPDYRNRGAGSAMMDGLMRTAADMGIRKMTLEVRRTNAAAQRLYCRHGFSIMGVRKKYYTDNGEDALIMWNNDISEHLKQGKAAAQ